jgi:L-alanine-DL-glutamate epimerase-like enolase superfamily enzyme
MPAEDIDGHVRLSQSTSVPIAIGESLYHSSHFREYLQRGGCSVVQVDVAPIGGITPWLKTAHLAETFNMQVCPHYLMEIHVALCAAVPNAAWVEFIPQLDVITESRLEIVDGCALPSSEIGLGISWDWKTIERMRVGHDVIS